MKKVVVDTNILISALGWKGNEYKLISKAMDDKIRLYTSIDLINESKKVALRPKFNFSEEEIDEFIDALIEASEVVAPEFKLDIITDDPADNKVLECALEGEVDLIVSGDRHLLKLKGFEGIRIVRSSTALKILKT